jgi:coenzyme PQQ synthesis protein D (PqqD)
MPAYRANEPQVIHQTVDEETVIVDLGTGSYFSLRGSSQVIWSALAQGLDESQVAKVVERRFEGDSADVAAAVGAFVSQLEGDGLIVPLDGATPGDSGSTEDEAAAADARSDRPPFELPSIERFDDLQDLILLDPVHEVTEEEGWPHARQGDEG